jgi:hypothetical protein
MGYRSVAVDSAFVDTPAERCIAAIATPATAVTA